MAHILGHGPNDIFADGVDPQSLTPVGPWTHISTAPYPGASGNFGPDAAAARRRRRSSAATSSCACSTARQTSLEVALLATLGRSGSAC